MVSSRHKRIYCHQGHVKGSGKIGWSTRRMRLNMEAEFRELFSGVDTVNDLV